jgi:hypothetical protein
VNVPNVDVAANVVSAFEKILALMPQHSLVLFTVALDLDNLPPQVRERFDVLTWRDSTLPAVPSPAAPLQSAAPDLPWMKTIEASHLSLGGTVGLGLTPGQRLGLEPLSYRDAASAVMQEEAARKARELNAMERRHPKRLKSEAFMNPARVLNPQLQGFHADFGRFTHA